MSSHDLEAIVKSIAETVKRPGDASKWLKQLQDNLYDTVDSVKSADRQSLGQLGIPLRVIDLLFEQVHQTQSPTTNVNPVVCCVVLPFRLLAAL